VQPPSCCKIVAHPALLGKCFDSQCWLCLSDGDCDRAGRPHSAILLTPTASVACKPKPLRVPAARACRGAGYAVACRSATTQRKKSARLSKGAQVGRHSPPNGEKRCCRRAGTPVMGALARRAAETITRRRLCQGFFVPSPPLAIPRFFTRPRSQRRDSACLPHHHGKQVVRHLVSAAVPSGNRSRKADPGALYDAVRQGYFASQ
jgi:hypothetical protein